MKKILLEYLIRECVKEVIKTGIKTGINEGDKEIKVAAAPPADNLGTGDQPGIQGGDKETPDKNLSGKETPAMLNIQEEVLEKSIKKMIVEIFNGKN